MMMDAIENLGPALVVFEGGDFWRHKFLLRTYFKNFMFDMRVGLPTADATGARRVSDSRQEAARPHFRLT